MSIAIRKIETLWTGTLAAAAHSSCFSMALALTLGEHKATPKSLRVESTVTLDAVDGRPTIVSAA